MKFLLHCRRPLLALAILLAAHGTARAQWVTESYSLEPGWNAIWLSQDCSHLPITQLLGNQPRILEIWRWNPLGSHIQYLTTPANPIKSDTEWAVWTSGDTAGSTLTYLTANSAYLVKVGAGQTLNIQLTGRPMLPRYNSQSSSEQSIQRSGLAFTGFPIPNSPPPSTTQGRFDRFFSFDSVLKNKPRVFRYRGGELSDVAPKNPVEITSLTQTSVERNVAYWIEPSGYTTYYGPIDVSVAAGDGLDFGTGSVARTLRVKNAIDPARNQPVTITITPAASADPPAGQPAIAGQVPLLLDEGIDEATLERIFTPFAGPVTRTIPPGGEVDIDFILNRGAMGTTAGLKFQSLVQVSDSLNLSRVDVAASAVSTSLAGLWVGEIAVNAVDSILGQQPAATATPTPTPAPTPAPTPLRTAFPFTMRVILHIDAAGHATLLQQAYAVVDTSLLGVLDPTFKIYTAARYPEVAATAKSPARVSSAAFPLDMAVEGDNAVVPGASVIFDVPLLYDAPTNPFLHPYHPGHDNKSADFKETLGKNIESYEVSRKATFQFAASQPGNPAWGSTELSGAYLETVTGLRANEIKVAGSFLLKRVANAPILVK